MSAVFFLVLVTAIASVVMPAMYRQELRLVSRFQLLLRHPFIDGLAVLLRHAVTDECELSACLVAVDIAA